MVITGFHAALGCCNVSYGLKLFAGYYVIFKGSIGGVSRCAYIVHPKP